MGQDRRDFLGLGAALIASAALSSNLKASEHDHGAHEGIKRQLTLVKNPKKVLSPATIITPKEGKNYNPVVTLNGWSLPYEMKEGVKEFRIVAEPVVREFAPGMVVNCWGYNGTSPGPTIEAVEGDRVRLIVTNKLSEHTTIHWHGLILPNGMDGVGGLTQVQIAPGETYVYEFTLHQSGTFMYHPHADEMVQMAMGCMGMFIVHPKNPKEHKVDRDFCFLLASYDVAPGTYTPNPSTMTEFNIWSFNSRVFPGIETMNVRVGDRVRIRVGNLTMTNHPIHMHGHTFEVTCTDGGWVPKSARWPEATIDIGVGQVRAFEFVALHEGDWSLHCHKSHHTMGPMGHNVPNMIGVKQEDLTEKISDLMPEYMYMPMGKNGMAEMQDMAEMGMKIPENTLPMMTGRGPFGPIEMGGMFTLVKVRKHQPKDDYTDPGWYEHPKGSIAYKI
ncbi:MAG: copper oxidase [Sulfuricurvum sp. GWF2_44_89]|uniref:Copper oxidase n=1 Tax=Sulfuricurvum kujiense TaxID=148813 RepID=A0A2D3WFU7_9BACT|nr:MULTISPECIES: copper oxidase [Sulfuricurvum]OHD78014.1 MAG: copper oxidase [Sulfuricurvum sp. GWF2_44_89]OHD92216.1 MAG: copper oxidase [Sulfuricurvum sp. RIFOXYD2_FULL_44_160]OHD96635.1 MAG: copper oxidase [Sulfuricurvum sp. RIFOXYD12_FULL_44_77]DAB39288.1 MAG TPA: copper oxidase [Sulfuricurvum kujiense]